MAPPTVTLLRHLRRHHGWNAWSILPTRWVSHARRPGPAESGFGPHGGRLLATWSCALTRGLLMRRLTPFFVFVGLVVLASAFGSGSHAPPCDPDNGGIKLPSGFCATIFADSVRGARQLVVAPNGDVFVGVNSSQNSPGGVMALRDADKDGHAEVREKILSGFASSHVALFDGN